MSKIQIPEPPEHTGQITKQSLAVRYEQILKWLYENDPLALRYRMEIEEHDAIIKDHLHLRHLAVICLAAHATELRRMAEEQLRKEAGTRILPGFKPKAQSMAQYRAKMNHQRACIEARIRTFEEDIYAKEIAADIVAAQGAALAADESAAAAEAAESNPAAPNGA